MIALFCIAGLAAVPDGFAAIYKYIDKDGMVSFADDLQAVPENYRSKAIIVSGNVAEVEKKPLSQPLQPDDAKTEQALALAPAKMDFATGITRSLGSRALFSVLVLISAVFAFIVLKILDADHKKPIAILRVVILWGVSIYLIYAHAGDVVNGFRSLGNGIENTRSQSAEKGKKAATALKTLDKLIENAAAAQQDAGRNLQEGK
jgi:hypothetical protein